ncbi:MAG: hypothetical protein H0X51_00035 [Parachlamydiaceae bacterium]|nr:hypothetical protein [Parachlamydiaceae bacterium]
MNSVSLCMPFIGCPVLGIIEYSRIHQSRKHVDKRLTDFVLSQNALNKSSGILHSELKTNSDIVLFELYKETQSIRVLTEKLVQLRSGDLETAEITEETLPRTDLLTEVDKFTSFVTSVSDSKAAQNEESIANGKNLIGQRKKLDFREQSLLVKQMVSCTLSLAICIILLAAKVFASPAILIGIHISYIVILPALILRWQVLETANKKAIPKVSHATVE